MLHPVEEEPEDSASEENGQECGQEPAEVLSVAPDGQLILLAGVEADLDLGGLLTLSRRSELLTEERLRRFLLLRLPAGVVVVDIRHSIFPV